MNEINHVRIVIDADMWQPFGKKAEQDLDKLISDLKDKTLLKHFGNVVLHVDR